MSQAGARPQLEDGYTRIANALYDAILLFPFSAREQKVVFTVIRKTYGYGKKEDDMSASQIGGMCGLARTHVTAALNSLAARNIITKRPGRFGSIIGIQKDHRKWIRGDASTSTESVRGCTDLALVECTEIKQPDSTDSVQGRTETVRVCTDLVHVPIQYVASTESVQVDSTDSVHTKENLPKENQQKKTRASRSGICFGDWMTQVKQQGVKSIPEDHAVFAYAKKIQLPIEYVRLCWLEFEVDHAENRDKQQKDWPKAFANYVRKNYMRLWYSKDGAWELTTRGNQASLAHRGRHLSRQGEASGRPVDPRFKGAK
jgi:phage replication O-like protein O